MNRPCRPNAINPRPKKILSSCVDNSRPLGCPQMNWGLILKKTFQSYDLRTEFTKWREILAGRIQWRAVCGSKMPIATKETPTSSRQDIWAELRYETAPSLVQELSRKFQISKRIEQKRERKIHTVSPAGLKIRRSFSYTIP
jgi:hypothetical protein